MEWMPIETAPRDGIKFLTVKHWGCSREWCMVVMHYDKYLGLVVSWDHDTEFKPTHWMPLPAPPIANGETK